jgi:FkbM family methyltransferase
MRTSELGEKLACRLRMYRQTRNAYQRVLKPSLLAGRKQTRCFFGQFIRPGDIVFDVGANVGALTAEFLELGAFVVAIEPQPLQALRIHARYRSRSLAVETVAVGPESGQAELTVGVYSHLSTLSPDRITDRPDLWKDRIPVPVVTLDSLIAQHGLPTFIKIDVEGYEREALSGLSNAVPAVSFEVGIMSIDQVSGCVQRLSWLGEYEFNLSVGYEYRLRHKNWLTSKQLLDSPEVSTEHRATGDVYARVALRSTRDHTRSPSTSRARMYPGIRHGR